MIKASGCCFLALDTGRIMLQQRSKKTSHPLTWSFLTAKSQKKLPPQNIQFAIFDNRKVDLFDHLIHVWEVVKHYNSCRILFCINCSALRPPKRGLNDRIGRLFDKK